MSQPSQPSVTSSTAMDGQNTAAGDERTNGSKEVLQQCVNIETNDDGKGRERRELLKEDKAEILAVEASPVEVKLRSKKKTIPLKKMQIEDKNRENGVAENGNGQEEINGNGPQQNGNSIEGLALDTAALLHRTMESLYEINPELEDSHEEIRKLDSQLDHLNEYMDKVEERIKAHNDRLMETLKQQKEDREKRRRSFHERLELNRQEEEDFQKQLNSVMNRVDSLRRQSFNEDETKEESEEKTGK